MYMISCCRYPLVVWNGIVYVSADNDEKWAEQEYEDNYFLPIVIHNLKSHDANFVIKHFKKRYTEHNKPKKRATVGDEDHDDETDTKATYGDITVIPLNGEKYLSFQVGNLCSWTPSSFCPRHWKPRIVVAEKWPWQIRPYD